MKEVEMLNVSNKGQLQPLRFKIQVGDNLEVVFGIQPLSLN